MSIESRNPAVVFAVVGALMLASVAGAHSSLQRVAASGAASMILESTVSSTAPRVSMVSGRHFDGRPVVPIRTLRMRVTAYSPDERSCGRHADGITASGYSVETNGGHMVAADKRWFRFGSLVSIPGYADGQIVPVLDRGGAIKGNRLDVLYPTHERACAWGVQYIYVTEWAYDDGKPSGFERPR
ncbi:MAG: 3D domain-containing protein [Planctomycetota bacterium]|nr:3D domain-containing protein [Planctomycetota bacterium]